MDDEREDILKVCFPVIFENELEDWVTDEALWPKQRDYKTFMQLVGVNTGVYFVWPTRIGQAGGRGVW